MNKQSEATHEQVLVKVTAWVDKGIAPLVDALNRHDFIFTVDSCQGDPDDPQRPAYVWFRAYNEAETILLAGALASTLRDHHTWPEEAFELVLEWDCEGNPGLIQLRCHPRSVAKLADKIKLMTLGKPAFRAWAQRVLEEGMDEGTIPGQDVQGGEPADD